MSSQIKSALPMRDDVSGCIECAGKKSRREFLTATAAGAVAALLTTACGGAGSDGSTGITGPFSLTVQVSTYSALSNVGGIARIDSGGSPIAVVRTASDAFSAFSLICPHNGCTVSITGSAFQCPCHGARFSSTGTWTGGQRTTNLRSLTTSYDSATGVLTITA